MRARVLLGFLIAPLVVPAAYVLLSMIPYLDDLSVLAGASDFWRSTVSLAVIWGVATFAGMALLGPPIVWLANRRGAASFGAACGWGFAAGALAGVCAMWAVGTYLAGAVGAAPVDPNAPLADIVMPWVVIGTMGGAAGTLVAAAYWAISGHGRVRRDTIGIAPFETFEIGGASPGMSMTAAGAEGLLGANDPEHRQRAS
jgi:hypothetical protein